MYRTRTWPGVAFVGPGSDRVARRSRHHRNAASVLPLPVGAWMSVWPPSRSPPSPPPGPGSAPRNSPEPGPDRGRERREGIGDDRESHGSSSIRPDGRLDHPFYRGSVRDPPRLAAAFGRRVRRPPPRPRYAAPARPPRSPARTPPLCGPSSTAAFAGSERLQHKPLAVSVLAVCGSDLRCQRRSRPNSTDRGSRSVGDARQLAVERVLVHSQRTVRRAAPRPAPPARPPLAPPAAPRRPPLAPPAPAPPLRHSRPPPARHSCRRQPPKAAARPPRPPRKDRSLGAREDARRRRALAREVRATIGRDLLRLRRDSALSQARVARAARLSPAHLCAIEQGRAEASTDALVAIADVLGADLAVRAYPNTGRGSTTTSRPPSSRRCLAWSDRGGGPISKFRQATRSRLCRPRPARVGSPAMHRDGGSFGAAADRASASVGAGQGGIAGLGRPMEGRIGRVERGSTADPALDPCDS